ncbi:hypothetical protein OKW50_007918 [Paraburkholderia youngii]|uniref:hypothetical protein n=1 Tax=Paraburkholderia youngii TaxID=2782701 RepID=UPI003D2506F6
MSHLLLLGAGFSRNWGGWLASEAFEYLVGCAEILESEDLRRLLWRHQATGGFENALAELQFANRNDPANSGPNLQALQRAVTRMFDDMNSGLFDLANIEFQQHVDGQLRTFLTRFDAIFTLNQDVLLEHHHMHPPDNMMLLSGRRWTGPQLPGLRPEPAAGDQPNQSWGQRVWVPTGDNQVDRGSQPFFTLHGSSNWRTVAGDPMLIMGGEKVREIGLHPILTWYADMFDEYLARPDSRLVVIGYGFRDAHINGAITRAIEQNGLRLFAISPQGTDLVRSIGPTNRPAQIRAATQLEENFERSLIGASRRYLYEIFGRDAIERRKVQRFFDN